MSFLSDDVNLPNSLVLPGYSRICFAAQLAFQYWHHVNRLCPARHIESDQGASLIWTLMHDRLKPPVVQAPCKSGFFAARAPSPAVNRSHEVQRQASGLFSYV